jgi:hypothetical protein
LSCLSFRIPALCGGFRCRSRRGCLIYIIDLVFVKKDAEGNITTLPIAGDGGKLTAISPSHLHADGTMPAFPAAYLPPWHLCGQQLPTAENAALIAAAAD